LFFLPVRGGARRTHLAIIRNSIQEAAVLWALTLARALVRAWAQASLAAKGTCLRVRAGAAATSASVGNSSVLGASSGSPEAE
jgi:class 3 adenylate cyclase